MNIKRLEEEIKRKLKIKSLKDYKIIVNGASWSAWRCEK